MECQAMNINNSNILPYCLALKVTLLMFLICGASSPTLAASATSQQTPTRIVEPEQVNLGDRITVYEKSGRVLELIVEEAITTVQPALDTDLTGTYISDITDNDNSYFRKENHKKLVVTFEQSGEKTVGKISSLTNAYIEGTREGDTIRFFFYSPTISHYEIRGEWKVSADGYRLEGTWRHPVSIASGKWNLTRLDPVVATRHADTPMMKGRLVSDQSAVEVLLADIDKIEMQSTIFTSEDSSVSACQMSEAARDAIATAEEATPPGPDNTYYQFRDLIRQAKLAAEPPACDDDKAIELAGEAKQLAEADSPAASKSSKTTGSILPETFGTDFKNHFTRCAGEVAMYGLLPIIAAGSDGVVIGLFTTVLGTVFCAPTAGAVATTEPSTKGSSEATSRKDQAAYRKTEQHRFFALTRENLARDMARGGGEYLTAMAYLEGCLVEVHGSFAKMTQRNFKQIIPQAEMDAEAMLHNLELQIAKDPLLVAKCSSVS
jgi:hypothetical protein